VWLHGTNRPGPPANSLGQTRHGDSADFLVSRRCRRGRWWRLRPGETAHSRERCFAPGGRHWALTRAVAGRFGSRAAQVHSSGQTGITIGSGVRVSGLQFDLPRRCPRRTGQTLVPAGRTKTCSFGQTRSFPFCDLEGGHPQETTGREDVPSGRLHHVMVHSETTHAHDLLAMHTMDDLEQESRTRHDQYDTDVSVGCE